jgi:hypothetical protein
MLFPAQLISNPDVAALSTDCSPTNLSSCVCNQSGNNADDGDTNSNGDGAGDGADDGDGFGDGDGDYGTCNT